MATHIELKGGFTLRKPVQESIKERREEGGGRSQQEYYPYLPLPPLPPCSSTFLKIPKS